MLSHRSRSNVQYYYRVRKSEPGFNELASYPSVQVTHGSVLETPGNHLIQVLPLQDAGRGAM